MNEIPESFKAKLERALSKSPYVNLLKMEVVGLKIGEAKIQLKVRDELRQSHGLLHGGATASLIDTATGFAAATMLKDGEKTSTADLTVHFLRPVVDGTIVCNAKVIKSGRRLITVSAEVTDEKNELVAVALSNYSKLTNAD
jgi:acyl-CoA thioesterase